MREKVGYREQLERIAEIYPNKVTLSVPEAARVLGIDKRTLLVLIQKKQLSAINIANGNKNKRYIIPVTAIARMSAG